jgi:hypothetical protein
MKKIIDFVISFVILLLTICVWLAVLCVVVLIVPWMIMMLWNWLAPIFWAAAPHLTLFQSIGVWLFLSILGGFFRSSSSSQNSNK